MYRARLRLLVVYTVAALLLPTTAGADEDSQVSAPPYSRADLPPLLEFQDGSPVTTPAGWRRRRAEIRNLMCEYLIGTFPEETPSISHTEVVHEQQAADGSLRKRVKLTFNTTNRASFEISIWTPPGPGPFPVLLTQPRHYQIGWAEKALARGYLVVLYPGLCFTHHEKNYPNYENAFRAFQSAYPQATWSSIATKAWLASRTLDYLLEPQSGYQIAHEQVGIIGHSRYGKQSLIAGAFDDRFTAVVARSPGAPGSNPYRFSGRHYFNEAGYVDAPKLWWTPRLGTYFGREHQMPIDAHGWYGLLAPRRCLIHTAHHDGSEATFAVERAYREGRTVYQFLGQPDHLRVLYRPGQHDPITDEHRRQNLDWFDLAFGRGTAQQSDFPEQYIHRFDWQHWNAQLTKADRQPPRIPPLPASDSEAEAAARRARIRWALGQPPENIKWDGNHTFLTREESQMMTHDRWRVANTARLPISFGANVRGNIYYNPNVKDPAPVVIWLHPYSYHSGYNEGYGVQGTTVYHRLAQQGIVVLAFDQCGFGLRLLEGRDFYQDYPKWSRLGRMVYDVRSAVDFVVNGTGKAQGMLPAIDQQQVFVLGYSLGGMVGLYAAALDERITGVASFCGFTPMRSDSDSKPSGGIRRLWEWHALQPLLGTFHGREPSLPYDFHDVLALVAPRPCLIYSPQRDREADFQEVVRCVARGRDAWPAASRDRLRHETPDDINRFQADQQAIFLDWLQQTRRGGLGAPSITP